MNRTHSLIGILIALCFGMLGCDPSSGNCGDASSCSDSGVSNPHRPDSEHDGGDPDASKPDASGADAQIARDDSGAPIDRDGGSTEPREPVDKIDLLFMIDNSGSMREEQIALRSQFARLIRTLLEGADLDGDGAPDAPRVQDVHLGVVSSDMGLSGIAGIPDCDGLGDDGVLRNVANPEVLGCSTPTFMPRFLTYQEGVDSEQLATDFQCIASIGTMGCGFEQQLESVLKAVWPAEDPRIAFLPDPAGFGITGQSGNGPNAGFLRNNPRDGLSLIAVIVVTDEEDCSSSNTRHFRPINASVSVDDPLRQQGLNTRCFFESQRAEPNNIYDVERYVRGFKALREGNEDLVVFGAIVGVPPALLTPDRIANFDFTDPQSSDAFYDSLLADPIMQERVDQRGTPEVDDDNLIASCDRGDFAKAYPPRRIVQVAKGFGANGIVQSICQDDFAPALDLIAKRIGSVLDARASR